MIQRTQPSIHFGAQPALNNRPVQAPAAAQEAGSSLLYSVAQKTFTLPNRFQAAMERFAKSKENTGAIGNFVARFARGVGNFGKTWLSMDIHEFPEVAVRKFRFSIAEPSKLMLLFLLYPFTVGPRLVRAYERGKKSNDFREVGDVLRRDGTAITIFLFLLNPLLKGLNKVKQKWDGLQLVDHKSGNIFTYSQFDNYIIDSAKTLEQIVREGNGRGLNNAVKMLNDRGLSKVGDGTLAKVLEEVKQMVPDFVAAVENNKPGASQQAEAIFAKLTKAESLRETFLKSATKGSSEKALIVAKNLQGEFTGIMKQYARKARLPQDVIALALCVGAIGWFPVWFNGFWNRKKFTEEQAAKRAADLANFNPQLTYQALKGTSRLARNNNAFAQAAFK
jgi:hypothetical protein